MASGVRTKPQKVYVMDSGQARKVGIAVDEESRVRLISREIGLPVRLVWCSEESDDAWKIEALAHKMLWAEGAHLQGEWFSASVDKCVEVVGVAAGGPTSIGSSVMGSAKRGFRWRGSLRQISVTVDDEVLQAIDDIRAMRRPVPTASEAVRAAILAERDALRRKTERERKS